MELTLKHGIVLRVELLSCQMFAFSVIPAVNCSLLANETCELAGPGPTCMWDMNSEECHRISAKETSQHNISFMECDPTESKYPNQKPKYNS